MYVGDTHASVPRPTKELKGFAKLALQPGETRRITVPLDARAFAYYDPDVKQWKTAPGEFQVLVGSSPAKIELKGSVAIR